MNRIKTEYVKRNIILAFSGVMFMLGSVWLYKNVIVMLLFITLSIICYLLGAFEYPRYYLATMLKGKDYDELSRFYFDKRSLNSSDRNLLITALTTSGDDIGLKKYLDRNALTLEQRFYYELYQLDKLLFIEKTTDGCDYRLARIEVVLREFEKHKNYKRQEKYKEKQYEVFRCDLEFYKLYISGEYEKAVELLKNNGPISEARAFHLAAILQEQGKNEEAEEYIKMVRECPGNSRFKKWLNLDVKITKVKSFSSLLIAMEVLLFVLISVLTSWKFSSVEKAMSWQYGIRTSENNNVITDEYESGDGVSIYLLNANEALYCYFMHDKSGYVIKEIYKDNMDPSSNDLAEYSALQVQNIKAMFYKKLNPDIKAKILTLSDDFEQYFTRRDYVGELDSPWPFSLIDKYYTEYNNVGEVENIEEVKMYDKTYYLVSLSGR